jgi:hypothetical protein
VEHTLPKVHEWPNSSPRELHQLDLTESEGTWRWQMRVESLAARIVAGGVWGGPGAGLAVATLAWREGTGTAFFLVCLGVAALLLRASYDASMGRVREVCLDRKSREVRLIYGNLRRVRVESFPADLGSELVWHEDDDRDPDSNTKYDVVAFPVVGGCVPVFAAATRGAETDAEREARERIESIWAGLRREAGYVGESTDASPQVPPSTGGPARQATHSDT